MEPIYSTPIPQDETDSLNLKVLNLQKSPNKMLQPATENEITIITKILAPKPLNLNALKTTMLKAWNITGKVATNQLGDNKMAFIFSEKKDMDKVLNNAWTFRDHQTALAWWPPDKAPDEVDLETAYFWVNIFGIPVSYINAPNIEMIGNEIGSIVKTDLSSPNQKWKRSVKIQLGIDINKPLLDTLEFACNDGKKLLLEIRYERLIDFCHRCGRIGHKGPSCEWVTEEIGKGLFGPWMKFEAQHIENPKLALANSEKKELIKKQQKTPLTQQNLQANLAGSTSPAEERGNGSDQNLEANVAFNKDKSDRYTSDTQKKDVEKPNIFPQKECFDSAHKKASEHEKDKIVNASEKIKEGDKNKGLGLHPPQSDTIGPNSIESQIGPNNKRNGVGQSLKRKFVEKEEIHGST
ncbi:hypothetical protein CASFOL_042907 [Castilleja foliolosa]|uniref:CCHC-type domain-containing protein n=1 Tax=Castilleja foliolosa TaxID=1961234 RepID=A0ABD3B816_9LAMI